MNIFTKPGYLSKDAHQLVRALVVVKAANPDAFTQLSEGLHRMLDQEFANQVRVPKDLLEVCQGRAQVAQDILTIADNVDHYRAELEKQPVAQVGRTTVPPLQQKWTG